MCCLAKDRNVSQHFDGKQRDVSQILLQVASKHQKEQLLSLCGKTAAPLGSFKMRDHPAAFGGISGGSASSTSSRS